METNTKTCSKCKKELPRTDFYAAKIRKDGLYPYCKNCQSEQIKTSRLKNIEKVVARQKAYEEANKEKIAARKKIYHQKTKERDREKKRVYYAENKEKINERNRIYSKNHPEVNRRKAQKHRNKPERKIAVALRGRVKRYMRNKTGASRKSQELLGCSVAHFRQYIEKQFQPGMTWNNHGLGKNKWNIDHIIPCAYFDLTKEEDQKKCFHYTNMRPLWQTENFAKRDKVGPKEFAENYKNQIAEAGYDVEIDYTIFEQFIVEG